MDTNAPDEESDFYRLFEVEKPEGYVLFKQPPAVFLKPTKDKDAPPEYEPNFGQRKGIPKCENVENHNSGYDYWMRQVAGKDPYWIKVFLQGEYGVTRSGKPVFENQYSDSFHCASKDLQPYRGLPLMVGMDYAHCACVIAQVSPRGQLMFLDEIFADFMGVKQFANGFLLPLLRKDYKNMPFKIIGDPSGNQRAMTDEVTCMMELSQMGIQVEPARTNLLMPRLNAMRNLLTQNIGGEPKVIFSPKCKQLRAAMQAKYVYRKSSTSFGASYSEDPDKSHPYSDLCLAKGTMIAMADFTQKKIENVKVGDWVLTGLGTAKVMKSGLTKKKSEVRMIRTISADLFATANHMIWSDDNWVSMDRLEPGDPVRLIRLLKRTLSKGLGISNDEIISNTLCQDRSDVYDLTVADHHSFFANGILVHNCDSAMYLCMDVTGVGNYNTQGDETNVRRARLPDSPRNFNPTF